MAKPIDRQPRSMLSYLLLYLIWHTKNNSGEVKWLLFSHFRFYSPDRQIFPCLSFSNFSALKCRHNHIYQYWVFCHLSFYSFLFISFSFFRSLSLSLSGYLLPSLSSPVFFFLSSLFSFLFPLFSHISFSVPALIPLFSLSFPLPRTQALSGVTPSCVLPQACDSRGELTCQDLAGVPPDLCQHLWSVHPVNPKVSLSSL